MTEQPQRSPFIDMLERTHLRVRIVGANLRLTSADYPVTALAFYLLDSRCSKKKRRARWASCVALAEAILR